MQVLDEWQCSHYIKEANNGLDQAEAQQDIPLSRQKGMLSQHASLGPSSAPGRLPLPEFSSQCFTNNQPVL